jgi:hypothetical protein
VFNPHGGLGGHAQPSPTIAQCLNGGLAWFEVECNRCKTRASLPLNAIRRPRASGLDLEARGLIEVQVVQERSYGATCADAQADQVARDHALQVGASGRGA